MHARYSTKIWHMIQMEVETEKGYAYCMEEFELIFPIEYKWGWIQKERYIDVF